MSKLKEIYGPEVLSKEEWSAAIIRAAKDADFSGVFKDSSSLAIDFHNLLMKMKSNNEKAIKFCEKIIEVTKKTPSSEVFFGSCLYVPRSTKKTEKKCNIDLITQAEIVKERYAKQIGGDMGPVMLMKKFKHKYMTWNEFMKGLHLEVLRRLEGKLSKVSSM